MNDLRVGPYLRSRDFRARFMAPDASVDMRTITRETSKKRRKLRNFESLLCGSGEVRFAKKSVDSVVDSISYNDSFHFSDSRCSIF